jgi:hypothetical protein
MSEFEDPAIINTVRPVASGKQTINATPEFAIRNYDMTPWLDGKQVPVENGWYLRDYRAMEGSTVPFQWCLWQNGVWYQTADEREWMAGSSCPWRGLVVGGGEVCYLLYNPNTNPLQDNDAIKFTRPENVASWLLGRDTTKYVIVKVKIIRDPRNSEAIKTSSARVVILPDGEYYNIIAACDRA